MASFERNPGNPVRATFYLLVTIEIPDCARSHRQQIEPLDIQSYLPKGAFRMVIFPMRVRAGISTATGCQERLQDALSIRSRSIYKTELQ